MIEKSKIYVVEHLDPELEAWSALEYSTIANETSSAGSSFYLTSVPPTLQLPDSLLLFRQQEGNAQGGLHVESRSVEELFDSQKARVCLLDPAAVDELAPTDAQRFNVFLFGGILGDDPPRDRTSELRKKGFEGRRLGPVQMTTDTAVRVTRMVIQDQIPLDGIPYVDHPELKINKNESTQMPFRYVKNGKGDPIMPEGMFELIKKDTEKGFENLF